MYNWALKIITAQLYNERTAISGIHWSNTVLELTGTTAAQQAHDVGLTSY